MKIKTYDGFKFLRRYTREIYTGRMSKLNQGRKSAVVFRRYECKVCTMILDQSEKTTQFSLDLHRQLHLEKGDATKTGLDFFQ